MTTNSAAYSTKLFHRIYVDHDQVSGHELREPFARLHAVQEPWQQLAPGKLETRRVRWLTRRRWLGRLF
ncbi:MAG TPA: hypothetical protein VGX25_22455 [Actinophytocola sp.]|uniref:hypothetical protein n=1 Tax=Actinophytocola sp. TaxID=1872138 RepID=UPI002DDD2184|nr:hypothetical protein [Actinophytocola sp.]HEV2782164.1 hypothetical protein [Actinophytocola sp.]